MVCAILQRDTPLEISIFDADNDISNWRCISPFNSGPASAEQYANDISKGTLALDPQAPTPIPANYLIVKG